MSGCCSSRRGRSYRHGLGSRASSPPQPRHVVNVRHRGVGEELPTRGGGANESSALTGRLEAQLLSGRHAHLQVFLAITPVLDHGLPGVHRSVDEAMRPLLVELPRPPGKRAS